MDAPVRPHRRLNWKYTGVVVALVAAAVLSRRAHGALLLVPGQQARAGARRARQGIHGRDARSSSRCRTSSGSSSRSPSRPPRSAAAGLVERQPGLQPAPRAGEALQPAPVPRRDGTGAGSGELRSRSTGPAAGSTSRRAPCSVRARSGELYFGAVYFQQGSQPHMSVAVAERAREAVSSSPSRPALRPPGRRARADRDGGLRLRGRLDAACSSTTRTATSSSGTPTSHRCRRCARRCSSRAKTDEAVTIGRDQNRTKVLSAYQTIDSLGWHVFVEEPLSEAFAPLESAIWRTAHPARRLPPSRHRDGILLARRLVRPIESIQSAAAKIGSGALDQRIENTSHDELGALGEEFNRMAEQLQELLRETRAEGRGADAGACGDARRSSTRRAASSRRRAGTSPSSSRTCRTSCGPR